VSHQLARTSPQSAKSRNTLGSTAEGCHPTNCYRHTFYTSYKIKRRCWTPK